MHFGAAAGAIGGCLMAIASSRLLAKSVPPAWRYAYGTAVVVLLVGWGALHAIERGYVKQAQREAGQLGTRGLSWSWTGDGVATRYFGPLPLFRFPTLTVHDWRGQVTDADLEALSTLRLLSSLDLRGSPITDAGLAHLKSLHNLESLNVTGTRVTPAAVDDLRRTLPNLTDVKR